jgi:hypothetical protein
MGSVPLRVRGDTDFFESVFLSFAIKSGKVAGEEKYNPSLFV